MKVLWALACLLPGCIQLEAQTPQAASQTSADPLSFSYTLPSDWEVVRSAPTLSEVKKQAHQSAGTDDEKKGVACVLIAFTARHGDPTSVIVVVELPFACFGQTLGEKDLPGFAQGATEGIKQNFDLSDIANVDYKLGTHSMWTERAKGVPKGHPEAPPYSVEITCTVLEKGAVCWMGMIADDAARKIFEGSVVKIENDPPTALVPADAFEKKTLP